MPCVSSDNPTPDGFPFFDFSSLLGGGSPAKLWDNARQVAATVAADGQTEDNIEPLVRLRIEELARVAELHVNQATGVILPPHTAITVVTRGDWARRSVDTYRPFFERFGEALSQQQTTPDADPQDPFGAMLAPMFAALGPMLVSTAAGSMLGHLGQTALGQYELPVPRPSHEILLVPSTIDATAADWEVETDDLRLWVLVHEYVAHSVLSVNHVSARLEGLFLDFASAFRPNVEEITNQFGDMTDLSQLQDLSSTLNEPNAVLNMMRTGAHDLLTPQLDAMVAAVLGFVGHTADTICQRLLPNHATIKDHFRRRWVDASPADRFVESLLGLQIDERTFARGDQFVAGIVERSGDEALERLWARDLDIPTPAEIDAPGLWIARIGLDPELGDVLDEIPDDLSGLE